MGDTGDANEPLPLEKDKKKKKLDEIVFGLSAAKGSNMFSPPMPSEKSSSRDHQRHSSNLRQEMHSQNAHSSSRNTVSPQVSSSGVRSGTPSPQVHHQSSSSSAAAAAAQNAKDAQAFAQSFLTNMSNMSNPLLNALSMFNTKELKDFTKYAAANAAAANLSASGNKKDNPRGGTTGTDLTRMPWMREFCN
jgi:hypothetical protein